MISDKCPIPFIVISASPLDEFNGYTDSLHRNSCIKANSIDPDQTAASDLNPYCLPWPLLEDSSHE